MQDMDALFGWYSIRNGKPYYPVTTKEPDAMQLKKKKKTAIMPSNELDAMPMEQPSAKQLPVEASNIYLVCCSCQPSAEDINGSLSDYKEKVAVLRAPEVMTLIGPTWRTFPLFYEVRWCELDHISRISHTVLTGCTYAAKRATGEGDGDREEVERVSDGDRAGSGDGSGEGVAHGEEAEEAASTIDNFTCAGSIPLCYPTRCLPSVHQHQTTSRRFHEGNRGDN